MLTHGGSETHARGAPTAIYTNLGIMVIKRTSLQLKPLYWVGSSKRDLGTLPEAVVNLFGYAIYLAQTGKKHDQAKPLSGFGSAGVLEVVEDHDGNAYRAVYTVRIANRVFVLHVFQKKSKRGSATPKGDVKLIGERLKAAEQMARELDL
jgi:phage-related protein